MRSTRDYLCLAMTIAWIASVAVAQNVDLDRDDWAVAGEGDWTNDDNWVDFSNALSGVPSLDLERWARISNGGTAILETESDTGALELTRGTVDIRQGGTLTVDSTSLTDGETTVGGSGTLRLSGNGAFKGANVTNDGTIDLDGNSAFETSGNFTNAGEIHFGAKADGTLAKMNLGGNVSLGGTISPAFASQPSFGDSFPIIEGADSITDAGVQIVLPADISFGRGLSLGLTTTNSTAALNVTNVPILTVNRVSGEASLSNVEGDTLAVTGYSVFSDSGLLKDDWSGLGEDWVKATPRAEAIAELNLSGQASLEKGGAAVSIGNAYNAGPTHPDDEDLAFEVSLADGSVVAGLVEYEGPANNLTLRIDPTSGEAEISHQSSFIDPFEVTGYSILSDSGALQVDTWNRIGGEGWLDANPTTDALSQINPSNMETFATNDEHPLGAIFDTTKPQDVIFEFTTLDQVLAGTVEYGPLGPVDPGTTCLDVKASRAIDGDLNGDDKVDFSDFLVLSTNFNQTVDPAVYEQGDIDCNTVVGFPDFLVLSTNFNKSAGSEAAAVPEPNSMVLVCVGSLLFLVRRRQR